MEPTESTANNTQPSSAEEENTSTTNSNEAIGSDTSPADQRRASVRQSDADMDVVFKEIAKSQGESELTTTAAMADEEEPRTKNINVPTTKMQAVRVPPRSNITATATSARAEPQEQFLDRNISSSSKTVPTPVSSQLQRDGRTSAPGAVRIQPFQDEGDSSEFDVEDGDHVRGSVRQSARDSAAFRKSTVVEAQIVDDAALRQEALMDIPSANAELIENEDEWEEKQRTNRRWICCIVFVLVVVSVVIVVVFVLASGGGSDDDETANKNQTKAPTTSWQIATLKNADSALDGQIGFSVRANGLGGRFGSSVSISSMPDVAVDRLHQNIFQTNHSRSINANVYVVAGTYSEPAQFQDPVTKQFYTQQRKAATYFCITQDLTKERPKGSILENQDAYCLPAIYAAADYTEIWQHFEWGGNGLRWAMLIAGKQMFNDLMITDPGGLIVPIATGLPSSVLLARQGTNIFNEEGSLPVDLSAENSNESSSFYADFMDMTNGGEFIASASKERLKLLEIIANKTGTPDHSKADPPYTQGQSLYPPRALVDWNVPNEIEEIGSIAIGGDSVAAATNIRVDGAFQHVCVRVFSINATVDPTSPKIVGQVLLHGSVVEGGQKMRSQTSQALTMSADDSLLALATARVDKEMGMVHVYELSDEGSEGEKEWKPLSEPLTPPNGRDDDIGFGMCVAMDNRGKWLAVGAPLANGGAGSVYMYLRSSSGKGPFEFHSIIEGREGQALGGSLSFADKGDYLAVGAPDSDLQGPNTGEIVLFSAPHAVT